MSNNVDLFRRIIERVFNRGDLPVAGEVCAHGFVEHQYLLPTELPGPQILKIEIQYARSEIRDLTLTLSEFLAIPIPCRFRETKGQSPGFASSSRRTEEDGA